MYYSVLYLRLWKFFIFVRAAAIVLFWFCLFGESDGSVELIRNLRRNLFFRWRDGEEWSGGFIEKKRMGKEGRPGGTNGRRAD